MIMEIWRICTKLLWNYTVPYIPMRMKTLMENETGKFVVSTEIKIAPNLLTVLSLESRKVEFIEKGSRLPNHIRPKSHPFTKCVP
jgi:hypothetical protein